MAGMDKRLMEAMQEYKMFSNDVYKEAGISVEDVSYEEAVKTVAAMEDEVIKLNNEIELNTNWKSNISPQIQEIEGIDGNKIKLFIRKPPSDSEQIPICIYRIHGGGMAMLSTEAFQFKQINESLAELGFTVISVEFRNSGGKLGNNPFPAGLNDCYSGLSWIYKNKKELDIEKIVLHGASGGGNLSIATTIKANRENELNMIDGCYIHCPFLDNAVESDVRKELDSKFGSLKQPSKVKFNVCLNKLYDPDGKNSTNPLAYPIHASNDDLTDFPPCVIQVNEFDELKEEGIMMHRKLVNADVNSRCNVIIGTSHCSEFLWAYVAWPGLLNATLNDIKHFACSL